MITLVFPELLIFVPPRLMVKLADHPTHRSEHRWVAMLCAQDIDNIRVELGQAGRINR